MPITSNYDQIMNTPPLENFDDHIYVIRDKYGKINVNIPLRIKYHSQTGIDVGYGGSGPADLALNILSIFVGGRSAFALYQDFKWEYIAELPFEGSIIEKQDILEWIEKKQSSFIKK